MPARQRTAPTFGYDFAPPTAAGAHPDRQPAPAVRETTPLGMTGLVDDEGAAAFFACSKRTFGEFMDAEWMPRPIRLGPRLRRWSIDELRAAVAAMPRETSRPPQPTALRARIDAMKGAGDAC
jgi:predicted DNA-binding transcriptional regulator AlpA